MTNIDKNTKAVEVLISRAAEAAKSEDAMRLSQAAANAANAMCALKVAQEEIK